MTPEIRRRIGRAGPENPLFKGGWKGRGGKGDKEYFFVWLSPGERAQHPTANRRGYIHRSHLVWNGAHPEDPVKPGEVIHHIDGDSLRDEPDNLEKWTQREHARHHFSQPRPHRRKAVA